MMSMDLQSETPITLTTRPGLALFTNAAMVVLTADANGWSVRATDPQQAWFWTREWQACEAEAEAEIREGRYEDFDDMDAFLSSL